MKRASDVKFAPSVADRGAVRPCVRVDFASMKCDTLTISTKWYFMSPALAP
jgi:hypothetical protein